jgi:hypothetical protein
MVVVVENYIIQDTDIVLFGIFPQYPGKELFLRIRLVDIIAIVSPLGHVEQHSRSLLIAVSSHGLVPSMRNTSKDHILLQQAYLAPFFNFVYKNENACLAL